MSNLSPKAKRALAELAAMAKSSAAERAAKPKPAPKPVEIGTTKDFVMVQVTRAKAKAKAITKATTKATTKPSAQPKPASTPAALGGSGTAAEKLAALANVAAGSAPCTLTREQLGSGPSEQFLRYARAARERFEEAERRAQQREAERRLRQRLGYPVFGV